MELRLGKSICVIAPPTSPEESHQPLSSEDVFIRGVELKELFVPRPFSSHQPAVLLPKQMFMFACRQSSLMATHFNKTPSS